MKTFAYACLALFMSTLSTACASTSPKILKIDTPRMPLVRAALYFPFGSGSEINGEEGSTLLLAKWMDYGTKNHPSMASFNQALLGNGAIVETLIYPRFTLVMVESPSVSFVESWKLALDKVRNPSFAESDLSLVRDNLISQKRTRLNTWSVAGRQFANSVVYAGSTDARVDFGTEQALKSVSKERLSRIYLDTFGKGPAAILASQSLSEDQENFIQESTKNWNSSFSKSDATPAEQKGRRIVIIERPGSTQAFLFFVKNGPNPGTEEHAFTSVGTQILGSNGGNSSLLFDELRAKRGLTYHASLQTAKVPNKQMIIGVTFGANEKLGELASLYVDVWRKFYSDRSTQIVTLQQADMAYRAMRDRENGNTIADIIRTAAEIFSVTGETKQIWITPSVEKDKFEKAKAKWLSPDDFTLIVLGDSAKIRTTLEKAVDVTMPTKVLSPESDWDSVSAAVSSQ